MHNWRSYVLLLAVFALMAVTVEVVLRALTVQSSECYGRVAGVELPPCTLHSPYKVTDERDRDRPFRDLVVRGDLITVGDLWGLSRYDEQLGYVPLENARSANGWWVTDHRGARVAGAESEQEEAVEERLVVIGDSFATGSRLPFEETWSSVLDREVEGLEVTNFGMDGYSMAQAYLRYGQVRDSTDHDTVLLMFVPEEDLWRDVNVRRDVGAAWQVYWVMPRFAFVEETLELVPSPFHDQDHAGYHPPALEPRLKSHLRDYDRFYLDSRYDAAAVPGSLVSGRLLTAAYNEYRLYVLRSGLLSPQSEAVRVSAAIFRRLSEEVGDAGRRFLLVVLPTERALGRRSAAFWQRWQRVVDFVCDGLTCIDLSESLRRLPDAEVDRGYDGTHFGPGISRHIASQLAAALAEAGRN